MNVSNKFLFLIILLLSACHKSNSSTDPLPTPDRFLEIQDRALKMSDNGWVVSRGTAGTAEHKGDALLWTGLALGTMNCEYDQPVKDALIKMLTDTAGGLYRHPDIPDEWSIDGAIGLYWGLSHRVALCHDADDWKDLFSLHMEKVALPPYFDVMRQTVAAQLGLATNPDTNSRGRLGAEVAAWAISTVSQKAAAYRLHLGFLVLDVVDAPKGAGAFCAVVDVAKIPLIEHFCGRPSLDAWLQDFQYNLYEYRHQRADWEGPDGQGLETPAIDYLIGYREELTQR